MFKSQKPNGHIIVLSFTHTHRRESIYREEETPFHWKINRFTVHHWGNNIKKSIPVQWLHRPCSLGFVSHYLFLLCFPQVSRGEAVWSGHVWQENLLRNSTRDIKGQRRRETTMGFDFHISEVSMCLYIHIYIYMLDVPELKIAVRAQPY